MTELFSGPVRLKAITCTVGWIWLLFGSVGTQQACASTATTATMAVTSGGVAVTTVLAGSTVTITATVKAGGAPVYPGQVNFCDAAVKYCTDIHLLATAQLTSAGTATFKYIPGIGSHSYKAVFVGTNANAASSSGVSTVTVDTTGTAPYATSTTLTQSGSAGNYTLTATVAGNGPVAPSGSVSFLDTDNANYVLGTANLSVSADGLTLLQGTTYPTGEIANAIVTADFNGDGILDIATASYDSLGTYVPGSLTILLGRGDGTFTAMPSIATGVFPCCIVTADFNGDGIPDLALASIVDNTITILLGKGDGTFTAAPSPAIGASPDVNGLAVGDFNGDGNEDLVGVNANTKTVFVLLGKGDGTFTEVAQQPATGDNPVSIAVGDFNLDGKLDIAVANLFPPNGGLNPSNLTILLGNGDGTFTAAPLAPVDGNPEQVVAADFNGDGILDLAAANGGSVPQSITVLLGKGDGTFTEAGSAIPIPYLGYVAIGDFNGDGKADIAAFLEVYQATAQSQNVYALLATAMAPLPL